MPAREKRFILRSLFTPGSVKFWDRLKSDTTRMVYLVLVANADDEGRVECDHQSVKAMAPRSQWSVNNRSSAVRALVMSGLIKTYRADGKLYAVINGFVESQSGKEVKWEKPPVPAPPEGFSVHEKTPLVSKEVSKEGTSFSSAEECFEEARRAFRRIVGGNLGSVGTRKAEWYGFVAKHGAEAVLAALKLWAREGKQWLKKECKYPLTNFLKNKEQMIEAVQIEQERGAHPEEKSEDGFIEDTTTPTVDDIRPPDYAPVKRNVQCSK